MMKSRSSKGRKHPSDALATDLQQTQTPPLALAAAPAVDLQQKRPPVLSLALAAAAAATTASCSLVENSNEKAPDLFEPIGEDVHHLIFSFALGVRSPPRYPKTAFQHYSAEKGTKAEGETSSGLALVAPTSQLWRGLSEERKAPYYELEAQGKARWKRETEEFELWGPKGLAKSCVDFSLVSRGWRDVTGDTMNLQAPAGIISPRELARLKAGVAGLELASVRQNFIKAMKRKWLTVGWPSSSGSYQYCSCSGCHARQNLAARSSPINEFVERFGGSYDAFAKGVAVEYTKFLVVKSVETIANKKEFGEESPSALLASWKEQCQPSVLVEMFWQTHMRSSLKYGRDCVKLIGDLLDFEGEAANVSDGSDDGVDVGILDSNFKRKKDALFKFEKQFPTKYDSRRISLFVADNNFNFVDKVSVIWDCHACCANDYGEDSYDNSYYGHQHYSDSDDHY